MDEHAQEEVVKHRRRRIATFIGTMFVVLAGAFAFWVLSTTEATAKSKFGKPTKETVSATISVPAGFLEPGTYEPISFNLHNFGTHPVPIHKLTFTPHTSNEATCKAENLFVSTSGQLGAGETSYPGNLLISFKALAETQLNNDGKAPGTTELEEYAKGEFDDYTGSIPLTPGGAASKDHNDIPQLVALLKGELAPEKETRKDKWPFVMAAGEKAGQGSIYTLGQHPLLVYVDDGTNQEACIEAEFSVTVKVA